MRNYMVLCLCALLVIPPAWAQAPTGDPNQPVVDQLTLRLQNMPQQVQSASVQSIGNSGPRTLYYWLVTNNTVGASSPAGPFILSTGPNTLSSSAVVSINWAPAGGAVTYDLLRTPTGNVPTGACNCAVATAVSGTSATDQAEALNAYTVSAIDRSRLAAVITNQGTGPGQSGIQVKQNGGVVGLVLPNQTNNFTAPQSFTNIVSIALQDAVYDVAASGIVDDGVTNVAASIQAILNSASAGGGVVILRKVNAGSYYLGATTLNLPGNVTIRGYDGDTVGLTYTGTGIAVDGRAGGVNKCGLENILISTTNDAATALALGNGSQHCHLKSVFLVGTGTATNTGTGLLLDGTAAWSSHLSSDQLYILGYKFGEQFIGAAGGKVWTAVGQTNSFIIGRSAGIVAGSIGIYVDGSTNPVGSFFIGGTVESFAVGYQTTTGGSAFPYFADVESNTINFSLGVGQAPQLIGGNASSGFLGTLAVMDTSGIGPAVLFKSSAGYETATVGNVWLEALGSGTGSLNFQAGLGSAAFGGGLILYSHSNATSPGWVRVGLSTGSAGKFAVNTSGIGNGTDVFIVDYSGNTQMSGTLTTGGDITLPGVSAGTRYIILKNSTSGQIVMQAGIGTAAGGGALQLYGSSHATRPGWVTVGLGFANTSQFTVSNWGIPGGTDVFTVDYYGNVVSRGTHQLTGMIATAAAPTVSASQIGYGSTTVAVSNCGSLLNAVGCVVINVAGTTQYLPYY